MKNALYTVCSVIQYSVYSVLQVGVLHKNTVYCNTLHQEKGVIFMANSPLQIRIDDETREKFKQISESFDSQGECVQALVNAYEVHNAKKTLKGMETNISDFQAMTDSIVKAYINVLELNANSENRIRLEFSDKLDNLNITIVELRERLRKSEEIRKEAESKANQAEKELSDTVLSNSNVIHQLEKELEQLKHNEMQLNSSLKDKQKIIDSLNLQVAQANDIVKKANEAIATAEQAQNSQKEAEKRAEALQAELTRVKEEAEKSKQNALERAEITLDKAVIEAEKKANTELKKITDEATSKQKELLDKLHAEQTTVVELTKELAELKANIKNDITNSTT